MYFFLILINTDTLLKFFCDHLLFDFSACQHALFWVCCQLHLNSELSLSLCNDPDLSPALSVTL